jgi:flagellar motor switch protein FliN
MTEPNQPQAAIARCIKEATEKVFSEALGLPSIASSQSEQSEAQNWVSLKLVCSGGLAGDAFLAVPSGDALTLAATFLAMPKPESQELTGEYQEAFLELFRQVSGQAATKLGSVAGESVSIECSIAASDDSAHQVETLQFSGNAGSISMKISVSSKLIDSASQKLQPRSEPAAASEEPTSEAAAEDTRNLELVMGVKLDLTLRFGQRGLTLREVLDLNSGSVVELDRNIHEPVELLLGDRTIARGEVVIVDGNYGLRVTEVNASLAN